MAFLVTFAGCSGGDAGPDRLDVSGTVTFDGQPLKRGRVYFEPEQGNSGPAAFAVVLDCKYDTAADGGEGHIGGKLRIRINAESDQPLDPRDDNAVGTPPPFREWQESVEFPQETTTKDIAVPKDADKLMETKNVIDAA